MKNKYQYIILSATILNFVAMLVAFIVLPNSVPVHFNLKGEVDRMGSPWLILVLAIIPVLVALGFLIEAIVRGENYKNRKVLNIIMTCITTLFIYISWIMFGISACGVGLGEKAHFPFEIAICVPLGILFMVMGNYMPVTKRNSTLGIKTRATLSSENVWNKTHRFAGPVQVVCGLAIIISAIISTFVINWLVFVVLGISVLMSAVVPMVYAQILNNKEQKQ